MSTKDPYWRILDANFNRAKEALRVLEDVARFFLNARGLTRDLKEARHALSRLLLGFPKAYRTMVQSRDARRDVGKDNTLRDKKGRLKLVDITCANFKRAQEAVRVLEEISKLLAPKLSPKLEKLRFRLYELEKRSLQKF